MVSVADNLRMCVIEELYVCITAAYSGKFKMRRRVAAKY